MELLEHEADVAVTQSRTLVLARARQVLTVDQDGTAGRQIETGKNADAIQTLGELNQSCKACHADYR